MDSSPHTDQHYETQLNELRARLLDMGALVERQIAAALRALVDRNDAAARRTIWGDHAVDRLDADIDEFCIRLLALRQPAARDLRFVTTALRITANLERIGDMAVNMCERALELNGERPLPLPVDLPGMVNIAQTMLRDSLEAFVRHDSELALGVCRQDNRIDALNEQIFHQLLAVMIREADAISRAIRLSIVAKYAERIADHATNIAEQVVFMVKGKNIRHLDPVPSSV